MAGKQHIHSRNKQFVFIITLIERRNEEYIHMLYELV